MNKMNRANNALNGNTMSVEHKKIVRELIAETKKWRARGLVAIDNCKLLQDKIVRLDSKISTLEWESLNAGRERDDLIAKNARAAILCIQRFDQIKALNKRMGDIEEENVRMFSLSPEDQMYAAREEGRQYGRTQAAEEIIQMIIPASWPNNKYIVSTTCDIADKIRTKFGLEI